MKFKTISKKLVAMFAIIATLATSVPVYATESSNLLDAANTEESSTVPAPVELENAISFAEPNAATTKAASRPYVFSHAEEANLLYCINLIRVLSGAEPLSSFAKLQSASDKRLEELPNYFNTGNERPDRREYTTVLDDYGIDWHWAGELPGRGYDTSFDYASAILDDRDLVLSVCDSDYTHLGTSYGTHSSTPYYEVLFHGTCSAHSIKLWNAKDTYYVPYGSTLEDLDLYFEVRCDHGVSYFPFIDEMVTGFDKTKANVIQNVTMRYHNVSYTFKVKVYGMTNFVDVDPSQWYYDPIDYVHYNNIMTGLTPTTFGVNSPITRGQFATILYRLEGSPYSTKNNNFQDVPSGEYFYNPINWASSVNIVNGLTTTKFGPNESITREQMAVMMYRYANYLGCDTTKRAPLTSFRDAHMIGSYATDAISWAVAEGLINGLDSTTLGPLRTADRAQCAAIIQRFMQNVM